MNMVSPSFPNGLPAMRSEAEVRASFRQFMIQQAVLNALPVYENGTSWKMLGTGPYLRCLYTSTGWVRSDFCDAVREEYRRIASQYSEAA